MKSIITAIFLAGAAIFSLSAASANTDNGGGDGEVVKSCSNDNVDCGDFPSPEDIDPGTPCRIKVDGYWLEGETNDQGQCVCEYIPPTTVPTTILETTTTTVSQTTTTEPTLQLTCDDLPDNIPASSPQYSPELDADSDGIACEADVPAPVAPPATPVVANPSFTG